MDRLGVTPYMVQGAGGQEPHHHPPKSLITILKLVKNLRNDTQVDGIEYLLMHNIKGITSSILVLHLLLCPSHGHQHGQWG